MLTPALSCYFYFTIFYAKISLITKYLILDSQVKKSGTDNQK